MSENGSTKVDAQHKGGNSSKGKNVLKDIQLVKDIKQNTTDTIKKNRHVG